MTFVATDSDVRFLGIGPPILRKGSHSFLVLPTAVADCFVAGSENNPLVEAFHPEAIAALSLRSPVVLIGPSGVGKTSAAATLASLWLHDDPTRKFTMTSAIEFSRSLTRSIKADDMQRFRTLHRDCDCLVLDNVHEIVGKPVAQEEFIATLDHLLGLDRAVLLTSNDIPPLIQGIPRSLQSRLSAGHSVLMRPPGKTARRVLLERMAIQSGLHIETDSLDQLAEQIHEERTALELRGILIRWSHQLRLNSSGSIVHPTRVIDRIIDATATPLATANEIAKTVSKETRVPVDLLVGPSRKSSVVRARGLAMFLIRQLTQDSYESIGGFFSGRDHTTVMHACKKTESELPLDMELSRIYDRIRQRFQRPR